MSRLWDRPRCGLRRFYITHYTSHITQIGCGGFILPLSILLVIILTISGTAFMQHDYLERRMAMNTVDNHGGFYLANAGIERARETFKVDTAVAPTWTPILTGAAPGYALDTSPPDPLLCPFYPTKNCVIPTFGPSVTAPALPFDVSFNQGVYSVRAFNDNAEAGNLDNNAIITFRALGNIRGEQKLIEATVLAVSTGNLINCRTGTGCPNKISGQGAVTIDAMDGREPEVGPIPLLDKQSDGYYPLTDSRNYYRDETGAKDQNGKAKFERNLPGLLTSYQTVTLPPSGKYTIADAQTYYFVPGDITLQQAVKGVAVSNVVIFSTGTITIPGDMILTNAILIAVNGIIIQAGPTLSAPASPFPNYPLMISGANIDQGGSQKDGFFIGNMYAFHFDPITGLPDGKVNLNPNYFEGAIFGNEVDVQGNTTYTDHGSLRYYEFMPGFYYPDELKTTVIVPGGSSWREIQ